MIDSYFQGVDLGGATGYVLLISIFCLFFLTFEAIFLSLARRSATRGDVGRRMRVASDEDGQASLVKKRRQRSLRPDGGYAMQMVWLNRLVLQSGVHWGMAALPVGSFASGAILFALFALATGSVPMAALIGLVGGLCLPILALVILRDRRCRKFEEQLPEAIDVLVRSLRAGHPVASAIRLVVRELPDPIGAEFSIASDEMTYGLDLERALMNVSTRVGQADLALLVVAVGIQTKTGGNLAEILTGIAKVIRERSKMRLKARALSAEGRFSALTLTLLPFVVFGLLNLIAPHFYGDVWNVPLVKPILIVAVVWMTLGDLLMYRMVKIDV
ncbi:MAG: type II secretion system F family protein [Sphingomonadales bacterium]|nr:type II secretion system F family protein [Sphingomonadales bacterium]